MEDLPIARLDGPPPSPVIDPHSKRLIELLDSTSDTHERQERIAAELQNVKALSRVVRRYLDPELGAALELTCSALSEFDRQPDKHISRLQNQSQPTEAVVVPLEYQSDFKKMLDCLSTLATLAEGNETFNSISWAQNRQLESEDIASVTARLRKCLATFDQYSKLNPAMIIPSSDNIET